MGALAGTDSAYYRVTTVLCSSQALVVLTCSISLLLTTCCRGLYFNFEVQWAGTMVLPKSLGSLRGSDATDVLREGIRKTAIVRMGLLLCAFAFLA